MIHLVSPGTKSDEQWSISPNIKVERSAGSLSTPVASEIEMTFEYLSSVWLTEIPKLSGTTCWQLSQYILVELAIKQPWVPPFALGLHYTSTVIEKFQHFRLKTFAKWMRRRLWEIEFAVIKFHTTKIWHCSSFVTINYHVEDLNQRVLN